MYFGLLPTKHLWFKRSAKPVRTMTTHDCTQDPNDFSDTPSGLVVVDVATATGLSPRGYTQVPSDGAWLWDLSFLRRRFSDHGHWFEPAGGPGDG